MYTSPLMGLWGPNLFLGYEFYVLFYAMNVLSIWCGRITQVLATGSGTGVGIFKLRCNHFNIFPLAAEARLLKTERCWDVQGSTENCV